MSAPKLLVIGLDGVPFQLLEALFARGAMPFLQSMRERGYSADLMSTVPPISAPAWTTFATGMNPGQHGILHFVSFRPGAARQQGAEAQWVFPDCTSLLSADNIRSQTIWQMLSNAGRRQIVVNVPLTYPPPPIDGVMVTGMLTPPSATVFTHPPELSEALLQAGYEIDLAVHEKDFRSEPEPLIERLREVLRKRRAACLDLMQREPWNFSMVVFTGTDRVQHHFWKVLMGEGSRGTSPEAERLRPLLDQYFRDLDDTIAALVSAAPSDAARVVLSDHGFGPISDYTVYTVSLMQALGLGQKLSRSKVMRLRGVLEGTFGLTPTQVRDWAKAVLPKTLAARIDARFRDAQLAAGAQDEAYLVAMHSYVGGIYINRARFDGNEAFAGFRSGVMSGLARLTDPSTGARLVESMHPQEEFYSGANLAECPDVVFFLADGYGFADGVGPGGTLVSPRRRHLQQQGVHRDRGMLVFDGPLFQRGSGPREQLLDITATILYLLDVPVPTAMESRPMLRAFAPEFVERNPVRYSDAPVGETASREQTTTMTEADEAELVERLRGLGYIE